MKCNSCGHKSCHQVLHASCRGSRMLHLFFRDTMVDRDHVRKYTLETSECWKAAVMMRLRKHYFTIC